MRATIFCARLRRLTRWLPVLMLAACALSHTPASLTIGMSTASVIERAGEPSLKLPVQSGARWFYVQGWYNMRTIAVDMEWDGTEQRVVRIIPALTEQNIDKIHAGMSAGAAMYLIGPPYRRVQFERLGATAWDYRHRDTWGYMVEFSLMVDAQNRVVGKVSHRIEPIDKY